MRGGEVMINTQDFISVAITAVIIPMLIAGGKYLVAWLKLKTEQISKQVKNENVKQYVSLLNGVVVDVVSELNQTTVDGLKAASSDGKLTKEDADKIKNEAFSKVLTILGSKGKDALKLLYEDVDALIKSRIERTVRYLKR